MASKNKNHQNSSARYVIHIPTADPHGNVLKDISPACWQWLSGKLRHLVHTIHSEGPHAGQHGSYRHLHVLAIDQPETDSHVKQLGAHIGDLVGHPTIFISKEGAQGLHGWQIANRTTPNQPAHPSAVQFMRPPT